MRAGQGWVVRCGAVQCPSCWVGDAPAWGEPRPGEARRAWPHMHLWRELLGGLLLTLLLLLFVVVVVVVVGDILKPYNMSENGR